MWSRLAMIAFGLAVLSVPAAAQTASSANGEPASSPPPTLGLTRSVPSLVQGRPAISARVPRLPDPSPGVQRPVPSLIRPTPSPAEVAPSQPPSPSRQQARPLVSPPPALADQFRDFCRGQAAGCARDWGGNSHRMLIEQQRQRIRDRRLDQERLRQQRTDPSRR